MHVSGGGFGSRTRGSAVRGKFPGCRCELGGTGGTGMRRIAEWEELLTGAA